MAAYKRTAKIPGKSANELFTIVSKEIDRFFDKSDVGEDYKVEPDAPSKSFKLHSKVVKATLYCKEGELDLQGELSFFLLPFKSKIDAGVDRWLKKIFGNLA